MVASISYGRCRLRGWRDRSRISLLPSITASISLASPMRAGSRKGNKTWAFSTRGLHSSGLETTLLRLGVIRIELHNGGARLGLFLRIYMVGSLSLGVSRCFPIPVISRGKGRKSMLIRNSAAYAFHEDPIAQAYYLNSGSAFSYTPQKDPTNSNFTFVARQLGCDSIYEDKEEEAAAELDCMRRLSFVQISNFVGQYIDSGVLPWITFNLIPDDRTVFSNYTERSEEGKLARVPYMISSTSNEFSSLVDWPVNNLTDGPYQPFVTARDIRGVCQWLNGAVYRNKIDVPVFSFQTAGTFPNLNYYSWLGAYHGSDTTMVFGTYGLLDGIAETTEFQVDVSTSIQDHILAFVKDPYHGPQKLGWNPLVASDPNIGDLLRFGANGKVSQHIDGVEIFGVCSGVREYDPFP